MFEGWGKESFGEWRDTVNNLLASKEEIALDALHHVCTIPDPALALQDGVAPVVAKVKALKKVPKKEATKELLMRLKKLADFGEKAFQ